MWHDPICGNKKENIPVPNEFERCVRYTRQVLVVQNMYTLSDRSVLVIPFSGHEHTSLYNVKCSTDENDTSYALPQLMFPADSNQLVKYIGVASDSIMQSIDRIIQRMLFSVGKDDFSDDENIIVPSTTTYRPQVPRYGKSDYARTDINADHITQDRFTRPKYEKKTDKKYDKKFSRKKAKKGGRKNSYNRREFKYQDTDPYMEEDVHDIPDVASAFGRMSDEEALAEHQAILHRVNHTKWDDKRREEFVRSCRRDGLDATAIAYNIKLTTAEKYFRSWEVKLGI